MPKLILPFFLLFLAALSTAACELVRPGAALSQDTLPAGNGRVNARPADTARVRDSADRLIKDALDSLAGLKSSTWHGHTRSHLKLQLDFLSNNVYLGRSDTGRTATFIPSINYTSRYGFYLQAQVYFIPSHHARKLDGGSLELGYSHDFSDRLAASVSWSKVLYNRSSTSVRSLIGSSVNVSVSYDLGSIITPSVQLTYNNNRKGLHDDFLLGGGIAHDYIFTDLFSTGDFMSLSPSLLVNVGTQNFYQGYFQKIENIKTGKGKSVKLSTSELEYNALVTHIFHQNGMFQLLDYEVSIPLVYVRRRFTFTLVPSMALPRHLLPKRLLKEISQQQTNFYIQTGIAWKF